MRMEMFNVQSKTDRKSNRTNQTKRLAYWLMEKRTKKKTIDQSSIRKGSPMEGVRIYGMGMI